METQCRSNPVRRCQTAQRTGIQGRQDRPLQRRSQRFIHVRDPSAILPDALPARAPPMEADPADSCQSPSIMSRIRVIGDFFGNSCNTTLVQGFFPGSRLLTAFQNYHRRWQGGILPWVPGGFNPTLATKKWSYSSPSRHSTAHCFLERKKVRRLCSLLRVID